MANIITPDFSYTYDGQLLEEILLKPTIDTIDVSRIFTVMDGINYQRRLMVAPPLQKIIKAYQGCNRTFTTAESPVFDRVIEVKDIEANLAFCTDELENTILIEMTNKGIRRADVDGTILRALLDNLILDALRRDVFRVFCFGDTNSLSSDYDQMDGLFKTLFANQANYCVEKIQTITVLNQVVGTRAIDYLRNLFEQCNPLLRQIPASEKAFFVTPNVFYNLLTTYENSNLEGATGVTAYVEENNTRLRFRGIDVIPISSWEIDLQDVDNPFYNVFNTMILYTQTKNHIIGTDDLSATKTIDGWFERKDRRTYFETRFRLGYQFIHCDLQAYSSGIVA